MALAGERELAGEGPIAVLIDHAAHIGRKEAAAHAIEHDLRHRRLAVLRFAPGFKIDRLGEAALLARQILGIDERGVVGRIAGGALGRQGRFRKVLGGDNDRAPSFGVGVAEFNAMSSGTPGVAPSPKLFSP